MSKLYLHTIDDFFLGYFSSLLPLSCNRLALVTCAFSGFIDSLRALRHGLARSMSGKHGNGEFSWCSGPAELWMPACSGFWSDALSCFR